MKDITNDDLPYIAKTNKCKNPAKFTFLGHVLNKIWPIQYSSLFIVYRTRLLTIFLESVLSSSTDCSCVILIYTNIFCS